MAQGPIGPVTPNFNLALVGPALRNSPTPQERACLAQFLRNLSSQQLIVPIQRIPQLDVAYVGTCGHIIEFRQNDTWIQDIKRGTLPP
ncbi:MAG TPA: hypothetical protein VG651_14540 [Stellaceae bacterium]|nr:hypothetical protein [Stellaceae bacterium]